MFNKLLKLSLALVCILLTSLQITASNNAQNVTGPDDNIVSFDSAFIVYKVHSGDYLSKIADEFGVPMADIIRANGIDANNATIYIGQIIKIPTRGRTNSILKDRKRRVFYEEDNELQKQENYFSNLNKRSDKLEYYMDSLKMKINNLEKQEVLDQTIDEENMKEVLQQMAVAKKIGRKKKALIGTLKKTEIEYLTIKKESTDIESKIANLQHKLERKAFELHNQMMSGTNTENSDQEKEVRTVIRDMGPSNFAVKETHEEPTESFAEKEIPAVNNPDLDMISNFEIKDTEQLDFKDPEEEASSSNVKTEPAEIPTKEKIRKFDESKNPVAVSSLEVKYEQAQLPPPAKQKFEKDLKLESSTNSMIRDAQKLRKYEIEVQREKITDFTPKKKPSDVALQETNAHVKDEYVVGSKEYERYRHFEGLKDIDITTEMDSVNLIKAKFYLARGLNEIDKGQYKKASKYISKSLKMSDNFLDAKVMLADLNAAFGYHEKAVKLYDDAIQLDTSIAKLYYNRAHCYLKMEENELAYMDFTQAIKQKENYILAYAGRASIAIDVNDFETAISDYSKILEVNNYFLPAYKGRGVAYMEMGEYEMAINDFNIVLDLSPREPAIYYKRGLAKVLTNNLFDACFDLWTASELGYKDAKKSIKQYCD
ncbi:MAG: LysM peptidoglycan-binding domain-containing protein [Chitinophagales bacterium]|nr:LysM peptidoglycan-binding domain-containing protein [Chitinophagales bacterium]